MATARFCAHLKQVLPIPTVTYHNAASSLALTPSFVQLATGAALHLFHSCSIVCEALVVSSTIQTWGCESSLFAVSSIRTLCLSISMPALFPDGSIFFLGWPTWARLAVVSLSKTLMPFADECPDSRWSAGSCLDNLGVLTLTIPGDNFVRWLLHQTMELAEEHQT